MLIENLNSEIYCKVANVGHRLKYKMLSRFLLLKMVLFKRVTHSLRNAPLNHLFDAPHGVLEPETTFKKLSSMGTKVS